MLNSFLLAQAADPRSAWLPVVLLIIIGLLFTTGTLVMSIWVGPRRTGPGKETTYESGMMPIGDARRRFNVRFYLVAMIFLVFDVEIVFFYPWAAIFPDAVANANNFELGFASKLLASMGVFVVILLVAYFYAWGKGVFRWD